MILVTGGAGFIGANFVLDWLAATGEPVVNLDKLTYAGNLGNLERSGRRPAPRLRPRRHRRPGAGRARCWRSIGRAPIVHFAAETHVDRSIDGPAAFVETNVVGTFSLLEAARGTGGAAAADASARRSASCTSRPTRSTARSGPTSRRSPRRRPTSPTRPTRRRRRRPTISCGPITTPTACRC